MHIRFHISYFPLILFAGSAITGCAGEEEQDTSPPAAMLAEQRELSDASCASGGVELRTGLDSNRNGRLDEEEVQDSTVLCQGSDGAAGEAPPAMLFSAVQASDEECPGGGSVFRAGLDDGDGGGSPDDGVLQDGEVDQSVTVCSGEPGDDGAEALITFAQEPPGEFCASGGTEISTGLDNGDGDGTAGNGVLEAGEIDSQEFMCNPERELPESALSFILLDDIDSGGTVYVENGFAEPLPERTSDFGLQTRTDGRHVVTLSSIQFDQTRLFVFDLATRTNVDVFEGRPELFPYGFALENGELYVVTYEDVESGSGASEPAVGLWNYTISTGELRLIIDLESAASGLVVHEERLFFVTPMDASDDEFYSGVSSVDLTIEAPVVTHWSLSEPPPEVARAVAIAGGKAVVVYQTDFASSDAWIGQIDLESQAAVLSDSLEEGIDSIGIVGFGDSVYWGQGNELVEYNTVSDTLSVIEDFGDDTETTVIDLVNTQSGISFSVLSGSPGGTDYEAVIGTYSPTTQDNDLLYYAEQGPTDLFLVPVFTHPYLTFGAID